MQKLNQFLIQKKDSIQKRDLEPIHNLRAIFNEIRDYFAGNVTGITRDELIAQNIMRLLFCKLYDEKHKTINDIIDFFVFNTDSPASLEIRINNLFDKVKDEYSDIFNAEEVIEISGKDLVYIIEKVEYYSLLDAKRDVIGDAFEELIGTAFRGGEGQFFTPRNVVKMMIDVFSPHTNDSILDPACGSGGFLVYILRYLIDHGFEPHRLVGIDKDTFLAKLAKIYLTLLGAKYQPSIFCENSLTNESEWQEITQKNIQFNSFDLILTNPPFGAKIPVIGTKLLKQYCLAHVWIKNTNVWKLSETIVERQSPQVLFIERCLQFLSAGGRFGIILPEGIFGNPSDRYIWEFLSQNSTIIGIVSLAHETFQPSTHTKTSILFLEKRKLHENDPLFMAIAHNVGHNKNGKEIYKMKNDGTFILDEHGEKILDDDLPEIAKNFSCFLHREPIANNHLGFTIHRQELQNYIYIPEYYDPEIKSELKKLEQTKKYDLLALNTLIEKKIVTITRGNEIGSQFYGTGNVPFIRTTDIVNWELKIDPIKSVSEEIYEKYSQLQDIQENDILFVNDGTFLIGRSAILTKHDKKIVIQSHLKKIRVVDTNFISPFYLFYLLNTKLVQKQIAAKTFVQATISTL